MRRTGFALLEMLIILAIVAAVVGSGFYFGTTKHQNVSPESAKNDIQQAKNAVQQFASSTNGEQQAIDQMQGIATTSTKTARVATGTATGTSR
ncbi:MAG TPA: hypothetical protein VMU07_01255 [Candidatus Paceibacterota bacterium]|nr:hypothetical protein [Candidatus Paceibacterota bacterium]